MLEPTDNIISVKEYDKISKYTNTGVKLKIIYKCTGSKKFTKSKETCNPILYMDDIKPFAKKLCEQ